MLDELVSHIRAAQILASAHGFNNILQPGLVKEMMIADLLGHQVHKTKHYADAYDPFDPSIQYEYLTRTNIGDYGFQMSTIHDNEKTIKRFTRNAAFFFATFDAKIPLHINDIYRGETDVVLEEALRQLRRSKNSRAHFIVRPQWVKVNAIQVYSDANYRLDV